MKKNPPIGNRDFTEFTSSPMQPAQIHFIYRIKNERERTNLRRDWNGEALWYIHQFLTRDASIKREWEKAVIFFFLLSFSLFFSARSMRITSSNIQRLEWETKKETATKLNHYELFPQPYSLIHHRQAKPPASRLDSASPPSSLFIYL